MGKKIEPMTELAATLAEDADGSHKKNLVDQLSARKDALSKLWDTGLSPEDSEKCKVEIAMIDSACRILEGVWALHRH